MLKPIFEKRLLLAVLLIIFSPIAWADAAFDACVDAAKSANGWTEPEQVVRLECPDAGISGVSGLGDYPNLGTLILSGNGLTSIDISSTSIFHLNVANNSLSSLTLNGNISVLLAANNSLESLDTSGSTSLVVLSLGNNNIRSLDLSNNPDLSRLFVHNNSLSTLDISNNQGISELTAGNNGLTSINLGPSGSLQTLGLANNNLTTVDIRGHGALSYLNVEGNPLDFATYELLNAIADEQEEAGNDYTLLIDFQEGGDDTITISDPNFDQCLSEAGEANGWNTAEQYVTLNCANAGISDVGELFHFKNLSVLNLSGNAITSIDVSANTNLNVLILGNNNLGSLDISNNTNLGRLFVQGNNLSTLDISNNQGMTELIAGNNGLTSINLGPSGSLQTLGLENNALTTLDITGHGQLSYVNVRSNNLDGDTINLLTGIAEDQGEGFTLLYDRPIPDEPVPEAEKINTAGGPARNASIGLGAYSDNGSLTYANEFNAGDFISLYGEIVPDPVDVGVNAELYALVLAVVDGKSSFSFVNESGVFEAWDQTLPALGPIAVVSPLESSHVVRVFEGNLQAGAYKVTIGYKAEGGPIVYMKPIKFVVTE